VGKGETQETIKEEERKDKKGNVYGGDTVRGGKTYTHVILAQLSSSFPVVIALDACLL
jgi:hypothetical protein